MVWLCELLAIRRRETTRFPRRNAGDTAHPTDADHPAASAQRRSLPNAALRPRHRVVLLRIVCLVLHIPIFSWFLFILVTKSIQLLNQLTAVVICSSRLAQRKRAGPITQRSPDRNRGLLSSRFFLPFFCSGVRCCSGLIWRHKLVDGCSGVRSSIF